MVNFQQGDTCWSLDFRPRADDCSASVELIQQDSYALPRTGAVGGGANWSGTFLYFIYCISGDDSLYFQTDPKLCMPFGSPKHGVYIQRIPITRNIVISTSKSIAASQKSLRAWV